MSKTFIIAELGINCNGSLELAKKLIQGVKDAGADLVKFQKRTVELVYTKEELDKYRESPWGVTNREQKNGLEFSPEDYKEIDTFCKKIGIEWTASCWDSESQIFINSFSPKYHKVASAMLTNLPLLKLIAETYRHTFISTGMSTMREIDRAVRIFESKGCPFTLLHCNSTYPMKNEDANLTVMNTLRDQFTNGVGYSGHEAGRVVSLAAVAMGATTIERHVTLDRTFYGSDQAASIELSEFKKLIEDIHTIEVALGDPEKKVYDSEVPIKNKLRRS